MTEECYCVTNSYNMDMSFTSIVMNKVWAETDSYHCKRCSINSIFLTRKPSFLMPWPSKPIGVVHNPFPKYIESARLPILPPYHCLTLHGLEPQFLCRFWIIATAPELEHLLLGHICGMLGLCYIEGQVQNQSLQMDIRTKESCKNRMYVK